jgi:hypothetical protein
VIQSERMKTSANKDQSDVCIISHSKRVFISALTEALLPLTATPIAYRQQGHEQRVALLVEELGVRMTH